MAEKKTTKKATTTTKKKATNPNALVSIKIIKKYGSGRRALEKDAVYKVSGATANDLIAKGIAELK